MAEWGIGSLRRWCAPTGVLVALGLVLAVSAPAATPSPDPPPGAVAPEPAPAPVQPAPAPVVRHAPVVTPAPVVRRSSPAVVTPVQRTKAKPKATAPVKVTRVVKQKAPARRPAARPPHDRNRVPLAAFVPRQSVDSIDRDLLAFAGFGLLLVAMGGAVVLQVGRRALREGLA
jgi:hypothetical protein